MFTIVGQKNRGISQVSLDVPIRILEEYTSDQFRHRRRRHFLLRRRGRRR